MSTLARKIAVVTGGTEGVGRGIASELAYSGARVFVTGRSTRKGALDGTRITGIRCDHRDDQQVEAALDRVRKEGGAIDILVNNVWGGYEQMMENGVFTCNMGFDRPSRVALERIQQSAAMASSLEARKTGAPKGMPVHEEQGKNVAARTTERTARSVEGPL